MPHPVITAISFPLAFVFALSFAQAADVEAIGFKGESTLVWTVLSSTSDIPSGALVGNYGGVSAGAAVGVGGNANALVGGSNDLMLCSRQRRRPDGSQYCRRRRGLDAARG